MLIPRELQGFQQRFQSLVLFVRGKQIDRMEMVEWPHTVDFDVGNLTPVELHWNQIDISGSLPLVGPEYFTEFGVHVGLWTGIEFRRQTQDDRITLLNRTANRLFPVLPRKHVRVPPYCFTGRNQGVVQSLNVGLVVAAIRNKGVFFRHVVSALVPYKRIDVAIRAAERLGARLKIVGGGPDLARLTAMAGPNVEFVGPLDPHALRDAYRRARALVLPAEEDFGIAPVESMACGRPVVALGRGGATETVKHGVTGWLVDEATPEAFADAMARVTPDAFDPATLVAHASGFGVARFESAFADIVNSAVTAERQC